MNIVHLSLTRLGSNPRFTALETEHSNYYSTDVVKKDKRTRKKHKQIHKNKAQKINK
jgi:hypothetical protein